MALFFLGRASPEFWLGGKSDGPRMPYLQILAQELSRTGDATGYHCATHDDFKVADTVFAEAKAKGYTREKWEAALEKAEERIEPDAEPDDGPLIITDDFY